MQSKLERFGKAALSSERLATCSVNAALKNSRVSIQLENEEGAKNYNKKKKGIEEEIKVQLSAARGAHTHS